MSDAGFSDITSNVEHRATAVWIEQKDYKPFEALKFKWLN